MAWRTGRFGMGDESRRRIASGICCSLNQRSRGEFERPHDGETNLTTDDVVFLGMSCFGQLRYIPMLLMGVVLDISQYREATSRMSELCLSAS